MTDSRKKQGFTLVELTIVMAFMSVLLLSILYMTIHAGKLYTKGVTNKTMNQIGREVFDLMKRDVAAADSSQVVIVGELGTGDLKSGRFCTGSVSYIWNTGPLLNSTSPKITAGGAPITFRRVLDPTGSLCLRNAATNAYPSTISPALPSTELLSTDGRSFALYTMTVQRTATDGAKNGLYTVRATLGTNEANTTSKDLIQGFQCLPPTSNTTNFDYCTVAEFNTILRSGGRE